MGLWAGKLLLVLVLSLQCVVELQGLFMRFTNITCESTDLDKGTIEYCEVNPLGKNRNSIRVRYRVLQPILNSFVLHFKLMTRSSQSTREVPRWTPFLYSVKIDMCQFGKGRFNYLARMVFEFIEGHSNLNHSCPYSEDKFIAVDDITNVDVSSKLHGIPLAQGFYSLFTWGTTQNQKRFEVNFYFEVLSI